MTIMPGAEPISIDGSDVGVVLCHGYPSTPQSMRGWAEHLASAGYSVRVPLLPGMGTHWKDLNATGWQDWYGAVDLAYQQLARRCSTVFAAGLSMGGLLATKLAQEKPGLAGLVVGIGLGTVFFWASPNPETGTVSPSANTAVPSSVSGSSSCLSSFLQKMPRHPGLTTRELFERKSMLSRRHSIRICSFSQQGENASSIRPAINV